MADLNRQYVSEFGWRITLPDGWECLNAERSDGTESQAGDVPGSSIESFKTMVGTSLVVSPVVSFGYSNDWSLVLTWMTQSTPADQDAISQFTTLTMLDGIASSEEATSFLQSSWPLLGEIVEAHVVRLMDETPAIEVMETFYQESTREVKRGYQLIALLERGPQEPPILQRFCFYAPAGKFLKVIADLRASVRSFHYD